MKYINELQPLMMELLNQSIDFKTDNQQEMLIISEGVYVRIAESEYDEEAVGYSVGAKLREADFTLEEIDDVVRYIKEKINED